MTNRRGNSEIKRYATLSSLQKEPSLVGSCKKPSKQQLQNAEKTWVSNFQILCSKDNHKYPKMLRELFESPFSFDKSNHRRYTLTGVSPQPYGWEENALTARLPVSTEHTQGKMEKLNKYSFRCFLSSANTNIINSSKTLSKKDTIKRAKKYLSDLKYSSNAQIPNLREIPNRLLRQRRNWDDSKYDFCTFNELVFKKYKQKIV